MCITVHHSAEIFIAMLGLLRNGSIDNRDKGDKEAPSYNGAFVV